MKPWVSYGLIRIALFAVVLAVLLLLGIEGWIAAIVAAIIAFCVSYLFLRRQRDRAAADLYNARHAGEATPGTGTVNAEDEAAEDR